MSARFWLSFADPDKPEGSQFLGVAIIDAEDLLSALDRATGLGVNPGGNVQGLPLPDNYAAVIDPRYLRRLLNWDECVALDAEIAARLLPAPEVLQ